MTKIRLGIVALLGLGLVPLVGNVFGAIVFAAAIPVVAASLVGVALANQRTLVMAAGLAFAVVASTVAVTALMGGRTVDEFLYAFGPAASRLFTTSWPSPQRPELVGLTSMLVGAGVATSLFVGRFDRRRLVPIVPTLTVAVALTIAGAPAGPDVAVWCWFLFTGMAFLLFSTKGAAVRLPESQVVVVGAVSLIAVAALGYALPADDRFDPRSSRLDELTTFVPPMEQYPSLVTIEPSVTLFEISGDVSAGSRYRTMIYAEYDGTRWEAGFELEEVGTVLRPGERPDHEYAVTVLDERARLLPFTGEPVEVDARIATDTDRHVVALVAPEVTGKTIRVTTAAADDGGQPAREPFAATEISAPFAAVAQDLVGDAPDLSAQLEMLAETMRNDWRLNPIDRPSPVQAKLLEDFVAESHQGGIAQFVAGFVLMARTLGADARMVGGFVTSSSTPVDGTSRIETSDARLWVEVRTVEGGWRVYDPVPDRITPIDELDAAAAPEASSEEASRIQQLPPQPDDRDDDDKQPVDPEDQAQSWPRWAISAVGVGTLVAVGLLCVVVFKLVRRWFWLSTGDARRRTRGAWAEATSTLIDAGLPVDDSWTDFDIVRRGASIEGVPPDELARLAQASRIAAFAPTPPAVSASDLAAGKAAVRSVRRGIRSCSSWRRRTRMSLSVRSVWPTTRTPVLKRNANPKRGA